MNEEEKNLPPSKMRGVAFPKAKYGAIVAVIIIVIVNLIYYKDALLSLIKQFMCGIVGIYLKTKKYEKHLGLSLIHI